MQCAVHPVMPCIFQNEEDCNVEYDCGPGRERNTSVHSTEFRRWVEEVDLRKLDGEMAEEDKLGAAPLLCDGRDLLPLNLVFVEV